MNLSLIKAPLQPSMPLLPQIQLTESDPISTKVTVGIINYNGMPTLPGTIRSLLELPHPGLEIVVADNASTDGSREWLLAHHPSIACLCLEANVGAAGAREALLQRAQKDYLLFLDNDIMLERDTLQKLMQVMHDVPRMGICHPEICDPQDEGVYHYNGGWIHYLGAYISREKPVGERPAYERFDTLSGAAMLVDRRAALAIHGFDPDYFFNWEDGDFVSRLLLAGYGCANVPEAIVHHTGKPRGTSKAYYMVRNRWFFILKLYSARTLVLIAPALLMFEAMSAVFMLLKGEWKAYWRGTCDAIRAIPKVLEKRARFMPLKVVKDRDWLRAGEIYVSPSAVQRKGFMNHGMKAAQSVFAGYWALIRHLC